MTEMRDDWFRKEAANFTGNLLFDQPLFKHTYYRIGGKAKIFATPKSVADIQWLAEGIQRTGIPFFILGNGSNLLVADEGYPGLIIYTGRLNLSIEEATREGTQFSESELPGSNSPQFQAPSSGFEKFRIEEAGAASPQTEKIAQPGSWVTIRTGASVAISTLLRRASQVGWDGLEFLTGIPGTVGGVVTMNGGTHLGETQSRLRKVQVYRLENGGKCQEFQGPELEFQYRRNLFIPKDGLIYSAEWQVILADPKEVKRKIDDVLVRRKATQPLDSPSCGSVFKNPKSSGISAWQVIDRLGLRGYGIGGAQFSEKHSNFILNFDQAKAADVRSLISMAKARARDELGIELEEEVIYLGF